MTDEHPSVCVGIVTRDRATVLEKAIASALEQDAVHLRVAVLDDGSIDKTPELQEQFPQISWTRTPSSLGLIAARNQLLASIDTDYFVSLDDDAWFMKGDEISTAIAYLEKHKGVAAGAFDILTPDRPQVHARGEATQTAMFIGCGHILRLSAIRNVGAYDPAPGRYGGEEKDLCLRLLDRGYTVVGFPGLHVWHDKTPVARNIPDQHRSGVCNDLVMTLRRTPLFFLAIAMGAKLYRHWIFARRNNLVAPFREGVVMFFRAIPQLWETRRAVRLSTLRRYVQLSSDK